MKKEVLLIVWMSSSLSDRCLQHLHKAVKMPHPILIPAVNDCLVWSITADRRALMGLFRGCKVEYCPDGLLITRIVAVKLITIEAIEALGGQLEDIPDAMEYYKE